MNKEKLTELYKQYNLTKDDVFKHQHYLIITRSGIEKLMAQSNITINYEVVKCEPNFAVTCVVYPRDLGGYVLDVMRGWYRPVASP